MLLVADGSTKLNADLMVALIGIRRAWLLGASLSKKVLITQKLLVLLSNRQQYA